jgi:hypothetical protein
MATATAMAMATATAMEPEELSQVPVARRKIPAARTVVARPTTCAAL